MSLSILYEDEDLIAIDKPPKRLVHRSYLARHERSVMEDLRDQIGSWVYPVHRLDRPTSGVLLFAKSADVAHRLSLLFEQHEVSKRYLALVRGWVLYPFEVNRALKEPHDPFGDTFSNPQRPAQDAQSKFTPLAKIDIPVDFGPFPTARYSLVEAQPLTGRRHQLRRHLHGATHPIIGDTSYGRTEHNQYFREELSCDRLLLAATELCLIHPISGVSLKINASVSGDFERIIRRFWSDSAENLSLTCRIKF